MGVVMTEAEETRGETLVAMVMLPSLEASPSEAIVEAYQQRRGAREEVGEVTLEQEILFFEAGGGRATVAKMGAPIPWSELEGPCQTSWWWETACQDLQAHPNHFVVAVMGAAGDPLDAALQLTDLVAAVLETTPALGVYWGSGTLVTQRELFLDLAREAGRETPPIMAWVDIRVFPNDDGTRTVFTTGLDAFGLMEIESEGARGESEEIWAFVQNLASYLLNQGPVINDGDTVGPDAAERIKVRFAASIFPERESQVYRLEYD